MNEHDNPFSPGDWVECVDPGNAGTLTPYRVYRVLPSPIGEGEFVTIVDDRGIEGQYFPARFRAAPGNPERPKAVAKAPEPNMADILRDVVAFIGTDDTRAAHVVGYLQGYYGMFVA